LTGAHKRQVGDLLRRSGALGAARRLRAGVLRRPALFILGYHRVAAEAPPFSPLTVTPAAFAAQIGYFARHCDVWPLARLAGWRQGRGALRRDTVVITFDDGYADNHANAATILERHGAPATFFVSTGPVRRGGRLWWDELRNALEAPGAGGALAAAAVSGPVAALLRAYLADAGGQRPMLARRILAVLKHAPEAQRDVLLAALERSGAERASASPPPELLTPAQLSDLVRRGFEIGAHGVTHASLPTLAPRRLAEEVEGALADLRALGIEASSFAYPYGDAGAPGGAVERALARAGVTLAVTTEERATRPDDAPLRLPRKVVPDQSLGQLATRLERLAWSR
jgi:peptidoglycan/xylan/chitin deacetylase (PgdA/CDA1 family)